MYGHEIAQEIRQELETHPERMNDDHLEETLLNEMHNRHPEIRVNMNEACKRIIGIEGKCC